MPDAASVAACHSPRLSAAATASDKATNLASSPCESDAGGDCVTASPVLLFPPPPHYLCERTQAICCEYSNLMPLPCQRDGCNTLVHHLCQSAWEWQEGYDDMVAQYCCRHHPEYKYRSASPKEDASVANTQDVISKARVVNVDSQLTTEGINVMHSDGINDNGSHGDNSNNGSHGENSIYSNYVDNAAGDKEEGGGAAYVDLPPLQMMITDYTDDTNDIHECTAHFMESRPISPANRSAVEAVFIIEA
jgi:hypothetical protein